MILAGDRTTAFEPSMAMWGFLAALDVAGSKLAGADELRDVKPPVDIPGLSWLVWLVLVMALAALGFVVWRKYRHRKPPVAPPKKPWEIAYDELLQLEGQNLFAQARVKEYFSVLSGIIRRYIEARFNIHAPEMTTEEFLNSVKSNPFINRQQQDLLGQFLVLSDMVKFAKYGPNASEAMESFTLVKRFVDQTKIDEAAESIETQTAGS